MASTREVRIRFLNWAAAEQATRANIEKVISAFERENPGIKVESIPVPFGEIRQQAITMAAGGNAPDVMQLSSNWPFELAAMGVLEPLDAHLTKAYLEDNWKGAGLDAGTYQGRLYAIPWGINLFGLWYNRDLMRQAGLDPNSPPKTWPELLTALDKGKAALARKGVDTFELFTAKAEFGVVHNWSLFWVHGAFPLEDGINFDTPEMANYFAWMRKMVKEGYTTPGWKLREFREQLAKDRLLFGFDGPYVKGFVQSLNPSIDDEQFYEKFGVTVLPAGVTNRSMTATDIHQLAIAKSSRNKEAALKFMLYLTSSDVAVREYLIPYGAMPPLQSAVNVRFAAQFSDPVSQAYIREIIPSARPIPYGPRWGAAAEQIINAIQAVVLGDGSIEQVLKDTERRLEEIYSR